VSSPFLRLFFVGLGAFAASACGGDEGGSTASNATGGTLGSGGAAGDASSAGGTGGSSAASGSGGLGGDASCSPGLAPQGSHQVGSKDLLVTGANSQRAIAIRHSPSAEAWAIANVIAEAGAFPIELRRATLGSGNLGLSSAVRVLDTSVAANTNAFDPSIAAETKSSRVLVVWADDRLGNGNGLLEVFGQFFDLGGSAPVKVGNNFVVSQVPKSSEHTPHVVFDDAEQRFWVAWADDREMATKPGGRHEYARSVGKDGSLGTELALGDETQWQDGVHAAVGSDGPLFVWSEYSDIDGFGRYRARLAKGTTLLTLHQSNSLVPAPPAIAWDRARCRFLALWQETASANAPDKQIWGAVLAPDGSVVKPRFQITSHVPGAGSPTLEYAAKTATFVATFGSWTDPDAFFVELDGDGVALGSPVSIHSTPPAKGTYYHALAPSDSGLLLISNEDYARLEATVLLTP